MFLAGTLKLGVLWKTVSDFTDFANIGAICIPLEPVPICATFWFLKLIFLFGHLPVWYHPPLKFLRPLILGIFVADSDPTALIKYLQ